jgi:hypothetical protein
MVPENPFNYKSALKTLVNIFDKLLVIASEKQGLILSLSWDELYAKSSEQQELNRFFDVTMKSYGNKFLSEDNLAIQDKEIASLKNELKLKIMEYKDIENLNFRLLKDAFFVAKNKVEKIFNKKVTNDTYTKDLKKTQELWDSTPIVFNRMI